MPRLAISEICFHCGVQAAHVALELVVGGTFGRGAHDETGVVRTQLVEDPAEALALVVGEPLRDAVRLRLVGHHHDEPAREAHLLREPRTLVRRSGSS